MALICFLLSSFFSSLQPFVRSLSPTLWNFFFRQMLKFVSMSYALEDQDQSNSLHCRIVWFVVASESNYLSLKVTFFQYFDCKPHKTLWSTPGKIGSFLFINQFEIWMLTNSLTVWNVEAMSRSKDQALQNYHLQREHSKRVNVETTRCRLCETQHFYTVHQTLESGGCFVPPVSKPGV